jgi:hypothetical protein
VSEYFLSVLEKHIYIQREREHEKKREDKHRAYGQDEEREEKKIEEEYDVKGKSINCVDLREK